MSLFISSLNSGSNGNCYYVGNSNEAVLVDVGISCREVEKRMKRLGLSMNNLKAVFISHEHTDHVRGLCGLIKKYSLPVYITKATLLNCNFTLQTGLSRQFVPDEKIQIGKLLITAFSKCHDAADPYSFTISRDGVTVGVFTDLGVVCDNLVKHFKGCHAAFLESNYDEEMLETGGYPYYLKKRIKGGNGHLSNKQALELFIDHRPSFMSHIILSHLSKNNNCPDLVAKLFNEHKGDVEVVVASRYDETPVYHIAAGKSKSVAVDQRKAALQQMQFAF